jgi:hypothetical protein
VLVLVYTCEYAAPPILLIILTNALLAHDPNTLPVNSILLDTDLGVIEAERPGISIKDVLAVLDISVFMAEVTCNTAPGLAATIPEGDVL